MYAIQTEKLTKYYGKARGIIGLDLEVKEGDFYGFIGPNGAGKSTTVRTLLGLIHKTEGRASILGMDIEKDRNRILSETGYLPSEAAFYPGMRVRDMLRLSAGLRGKDCLKNASELCERLLLNPDSRMDTLSYGNRRKAAVVCALQHEPRLCILDEPTGGLDPLMQREFFSILREYNEKGMTVFLSSHVLSEIQRYCTRAAIIREGRIIASGSVEELSRTNARRVSVRGRFDLSSLAGASAGHGRTVQIRDVQELEDGVSFLFDGEINLLLSALAAHPVQDVSISEPDLEEIFLHYYTDGGEKP